MLFHVVYFKIASNVSEEQIKNLYNGFNCLKDIPGVKSIQYGEADTLPYKSYQNRTKGYNYCLLVVLKNKNYLEDYEYNQIHNLVRATIIKPLLDPSAEQPIIALDFEGEHPEPSLWNTTKILINTPTKALTVAAVLSILAFGVRWRYFR
jgi:hypothetical protein